MNWFDDNKDNFFMSVKGNYDGKWFTITKNLAKEIYEKYKKEIIENKK